MPDDVHDIWVQTALGRNPASYGGASAGPADPAPGGPAAPGPDPDAIAATIAQLASLQAKMEAAGIGSKPLAIQVQELSDALDTARLQGDPETRTGMLDLVEARAGAALIQARGDAAAQAKFLAVGAQAGIKDLRDEAAAQIARVKDPDEKAPLAAKLKTLDQQIGALAQQTDPAQHRQAQSKLDKDARRLFDEAADANEDSDAVQRVYKKALQDKYGFKIDNSIKTKNTHFEDIYEMFEKVPADNVVQARLQTLQYIKKKNYGQFHGATIRMGNYEDGADTDSYVNPLTGAPMGGNAFAITALHELGHAMDHRWGVMEAHMARTGCGGWQKETQDTVAQAIVADFMGKGGKALDMVPSLLESLVYNVLEDGDASQPDVIDNPADWKAIAPLLQHCLKLRDPEKNKPWRKPWQIGDRAYHESYSGTWVSVDWAARNNKALTVRPYQWRAPGEFFAELYAYSWFTKKPVGNAVDQVIRQYLYPGS